MLQSRRGAGASHVALGMLLAGALEVTGVAIASWNTCALTSEQHIYCWEIDVPTLVDWRSALE